MRLPLGQQPAQRIPAPRHLGLRASRQQQPAQGVVLEVVHLAIGQVLAHQAAQAVALQPRHAPAQRLAGLGLHDSLENKALSSELPGQRS